MNVKLQKYSVVLGARVISLFLILTLAFEGIVTFQKIDGQQEEQQNSTNFTNNDISDDISNQSSSKANQSGIGVNSVENKTVVNQTGIAALSANFTQGDFESLKLDLTEARQALDRNDTITLLDELNSASGELFQVISNQFDPANVEAMTHEFNPLQNHIDHAQEAALKGNHTGTLEELDAAESELLKVTQMLPASQE